MKVNVKDVKGTKTRPVVSLATSRTPSNVSSRKRRSSSSSLGKGGWWTTRRPSPVRPVRAVVSGEDTSAIIGGDEGVILERDPNKAGGEGKRGKYHIHTFGCQMNMADSERMAGILEGMGYTNSTDPKDANVLVYNTCSIREKAEVKVYSALGEQAKRKQEQGRYYSDTAPVVSFPNSPRHASRQTCASRTFTN